MLRQIFIFLFILFVNSYIYAQQKCIYADVEIPPCLVVGEPVTFYNTSIDNTDPTLPCNSNQNQTPEYEWNFESWNGNYEWDTTTIGTNIDLNHVGFPDVGWYTLELEVDIPGNNGWCCPNTQNQTVDIEVDFYVYANSIAIQTTDSIIVCGGNPVDTSAINLIISNSSNNISFIWQTIPSGNPVNGIASGNINSTESAIILTVTDEDTQCSDQDTIFLAFTPTSITNNPSILIDPDSAVCAGNSINFYVTSPDTISFSYSWDVQGIQYNSDSINTSLYPTIPNTDQNIVVDLTITEDSLGCSETFSYNTMVGATPFINLDISNSNNSLTDWDSTLQVFLVCDVANSAVNFTFGNSSLTNFQNYDSIIFQWPDTTEVIDSNHILFPFNSTDYISHIFYESWTDKSFSITAFNNGCSFTTDYNVVIGSNLNTPAHF